MSCLFSVPVPAAVHILTALSFRRGPLWRCPVVTIFLPCATISQDNNILWITQSQVFRSSRSKQNKKLYGSSPRIIVNDCFKVAQKYKIICDLGEFSRLWIVHLKSKDKCLLDFENVRSVIFSFQNNLIFSYCNFSFATSSGAQGLTQAALECLFQPPRLKE